MPPRRAATLPAAMTSRLKSINELIWGLKDAIRDRERRQDFGPALSHAPSTMATMSEQRSGAKSTQSCVQV